MQTIRTYARMHTLVICFRRKRRIFIRNMMAAGTAREQPAQQGAAFLASGRLRRYPDRCSFGEVPPPQLVRPSGKKSAMAGVAEPSRRVLMAHEPTSTHTAAYMQARRPDCVGEG